MRFKIDENLPVEIAELLRAAGHEAMTTRDQGLIGRPDEHVAEVCRIENRAIVTLDLDFGDIRRYPANQYAGIVVMRVSRQDRPHVIEVFKRVLPIISRETLAGRLWIVDDDRLRIRGGEAERGGS